VEGGREGSVNGEKKKSFEGVICSSFSLVSSLIFVLSLFGPCLLGGCICASWQDFRVCVISRRECRYIVGRKKRRDGGRERRKQGKQGGREGGERMMKDGTRRILVDTGEKRKEEGDE